MTLKTKVIINEVTNLSDARYCAGMGVDYIGFRIDNDHNKYIDPKDFKEITEWVSGVSFMGETSKHVDSDTSEYNINEILIDQIEALSSYIREAVFWSLSIDKISDYSPLMIDNQQKIKGIILTAEEQEVSKENKKLIKNLASTFDIYLGYGINSENVIQLITELPIKGLSLKGSEEIRPGYKDYDELADILESLDED